MVISHQTPAGDNLYVIIVAAGRGTRFGSNTPKQFLPLKGKPVVLHALEAFSAEFPNARIILVLSPDGGSEYWQEISQSYTGIKPYITEGGDSRTASVRNALSAVKSLGADSDSIVMIHDGARPIINRTMIRALYRLLTEKEEVHAAVPCYLPSEALSEGMGDTLVPVSRSNYRLVQTPQTFDALMLIKAYDECHRSAGNAIYDDDAAVFHAFAPEDCNNIYNIEGDRNNIKITRPADIRIAEILMDQPLEYACNTSL